jgi:uncharacterized protein YbjT (DUF2867 family)
MTQQAKILVTGATGSIGDQLTGILSASGIHFSAMIRPGTHKRAIYDLPGCTVVEGDFNDPESVAAALTGVDKAFLLTNSSELAEKQQLDFLSAAKKAGVRHIVKLSQWAADLHSPVRFLRYHAVVENAIKDSGLAYTFLRPNLFMQGLLGFRETIIKQNQFYGAVGSARISMIDIRDIACVAAAALTSPGHEGKIYNLTGPEALTHNEMADKLSAATGRKIGFVDISPEVLKKIVLSVGFPEWQADGLIEDYAHYKLGEAAELKNGVFEATGKKPLDFSAFAADHASLLMR